MKTYKCNKILQMLEKSYIQKAGEHKDDGQSQLGHKSRKLDDNSGQKGNHPARWKKGQ